MTSECMVRYQPTAIGRLIAERRARADMSQDDLARACNVARSAIANIEYGKTKSPSVELVNAISKVLPVSIRELLRAIGYDINGEVDLLETVLAEEDEAVSLLRGRFEAIRRRLGGSPEPASGQTRD